MAGRGFGWLGCYVRDNDDRVYETYWTTDRGNEAGFWSYGLLDRTVFGRQEPWEDSPQGWPKIPVGQHRGVPTAARWRNGMSPANLSHRRRSYAARRSRNARSLKALPPNRGSGDDRRPPATISIPEATSPDRIDAKADHAARTYRPSDAVLVQACDHGCPRGIEEASWVNPRTV
jgi:Bacterial protein of unknown function (DUF899)